MKPSDMKGWYQAIGHLMIFFMTGLVTVYFFSQKNWIGFAAALFAHGTVGSFFRLAVHELAHGTVFKTKWLNQLFLRIYSLLGWWNFHEYAMSHTYHHRYTLFPRGDREVVLPREPSVKAFYLLQLFTLNVFGGLESSGLIPIVKGTMTIACGGYEEHKREWIQSLYKDHPIARKQAVNWARLILVFHLGVLALSILLQFWLLFLLVSLHLFFGNWLRYFVGMPMHSGLRSTVTDFRKCVRTIKLDPISEFLYWHMNWHLEHHMYAGVPCYNLKKLHTEIAHDMPRPRSLFGAWQEMRKTWKHQQINPRYEYDTPIPAATVRSDKEMDDIASSIGDITPEALKG
jgi:fatty acid desaturase